MDKGTKERKRTHVKKGDTVFVLTGKDRGKKGKVLKSIPSEMRVIVEGVNMVTKHKRPTGRGQQGGIIHQEASVDSSNVMLCCPKCGAGTRIGMEVTDTGRKYRKCKKCGDVIDIVLDGKDQGR
ncbi:MAG: 50S ribosomal protein L24 [Oscillospiraceae bacterium]|nr:50S ribosomal protein L24 [Oscillospiraceae bacterium]